MNNEQKIQAFLRRFTSVNCEENVYTPKPNQKALKVQKTVYPNGTKQMSLDGITEFYGLQQR